MEHENLRYGDFAYLKVKEITNYGAFLDTGGDKDLLLPFSEQSKNFGNRLKKLKPRNSGVFL